MASGFDALPGWRDEDAAEAFACFRRSAEAITCGTPALRLGRAATPALVAVAEAVCRAPEGLGPDDARAFFERHFQPVRSDLPAFFTGYYEPEVDGALVPSADFTAPILDRPADLLTLTPDEAGAAGLTGLAAARVSADGSLSPYPVRAEIERDAMDGRRPALLWLRDWVEVFLIQVQGSARIRLPDGRRLRLTYAGRNGHPYTSIGRRLIEVGAIAPDEMSLARLKAWLREAGQAWGEDGRALMQTNGSYIFFSAGPASTDEGPIAGQGVALTPLRSIAVDRAIWSYGQPFWIAAELPWQGAGSPPLRRLAIAQDCGSAIVGEGRVDFFLGSGDVAGARAGSIRHTGRIVELRPRDLGGRGT